jgi:carboxyl-terminal processing protease
MPRRNLAWFLGIAGVFLLGYTVSRSAPTHEQDQDYTLVSLVVEVMKEVEGKYVRPLDPAAKRQLVEDMINGGLERLDPHSSFINAKDYKRFVLSSKGTFGGVGIQISTDRARPNRLIVFSPMVGTPAYDAGVLAGDVILKIDGKSTESMRLSDAIDLITGEPGQDITLTVQHANSRDPVDIKMTRAKIQVPTVLGDVRKPDDGKEWEFMLDPSSKIAYIRLLAFTERTADEVRAVLTGLKKEGIHGLILDLRTNPGGLLLSAVDIGRMFLPSGRIVSTQGRNQPEETYDANGKGGIFTSAKECPMVVLINGLSASASEIVAAALQDHKRAVVIGERSYGKGSVQNIIKVEGNTSALKLTTASYQRPSGKNIHRFPDSKEADEWGVKPDDGFEVKLTEEERYDYLEYRRDRDIVRDKGGALPPKPQAAKERDKHGKPFVDRTLEKALDYLRHELNKASAAPGAPEMGNG